MKKLLVILFIAAAATTYAQHAMNFDDLAGMRRIGAPKISPDGKWIAYDAITVDLPANAKNSAVYLMPASGGAAKRIASGDTPAWSPDGKTIAYLSSQAYLYDVASGKSTKLTHLENGAGNVKWVPDGSAIVVTSDVDLGAAEEAKPTKARVIDTLLYRHWNAWQEPTRTHIIYIPLNGSATRDLTPGAFDAPPFSVGGGNEFDVSPDSKELVFARDTDEHPERSTNSDLFLVPLVASAGGGTPKRITTRTGADTSPSYSPDGRYIAYRSQARAGYESDLWELWLYDRATNQSKRIASEFTDWIESVKWSPDSKSMFLIAPLKGAEAIYEVTLDGKMTLITQSGSASEVDVARDGKTIYFDLSTLTRPSDIYSMRPGSTPKKLTTENDAKLAQVAMGEPASTWWKGADDTPVQGWLIKPPHFDASKKYPAVVLIHGGPQGAWSNGWSYRWNGEMFAARGYVVLMPNPRGSSGFGQQFLEEISRDWGGRVYTDIMNGVDMLAALPYVDGNRIGAAGASFGGYMVDWILGHTNRFKALVTHDGVYNLESMYGVTEELWFPEWEFGGTPWDNPELYEKWSPHRFVKNFATPTLVVHGELDYRVPIDQGLQLFTALQRRGVPSRLLLFPDEGHWVLKPQNSKLWHQTVLDWLDRWLK
ncbi:MAG: S9 family peptidase [Acidobacteria bacterium]|nr:MAG: S9 family peptidase [Acidobacteriota bacterium]